MIVKRHSRLGRFGADAGTLLGGVPAQAFASLYDTLEIRTAITPPVNINVAQLLSQGQGGQPSQPDLIVRLLKPTVVLHGAAGDINLSPSGDPGDGTWVLVGLVTGLLLTGFMVGRWSA